MLYPSPGFENQIEIYTGVYCCQGDYRADDTLAFQKVWRKQEEQRWVYNLTDHHALHS